MGLLTSRRDREWGRAGMAQREQLTDCTMVIGDFPVEDHDSERTK